MPRFFVENADNSFITVTGENANHIGRSLRMRVGERLTLCCEGVEYECEIDRFTADEVGCRVLSFGPSKNEPATKVTLFQAVPKGDKAELIVQKAVELGVHEVCFIMTDRCVSRPDEKSFAKKLLRLGKISLEAAKQSGRGIIPKVSGIISLGELADRLRDFDKALMCYEKGGIRLNDAGIAPRSSIALIIGSEGGFEEDEAQLIKNAGGELITLGRRILRCETAPVAALGIVMNIAGEI